MAHDNSRSRTMLASLITHPVRIGRPRIGELPGPIMKALGFIAYSLLQINRRATTNYTVA